MRRKPKPQNTKLKNEPAERDAAEIRRAVQMTGDGGIDRAENRLRQIGEDDGKRKREHALRCQCTGSAGAAMPTCPRARGFAQLRSCTHTQGETTTAHRSGRARRNRRRSRPARARRVPRTAIA